MRKKILQLFIPVVIIAFGAACQATGIKEQKKISETKKVKTEDMKTLTKKQFYKINKKKSASGDGWELIYYNKDKILISNVTSLIILRRIDSRFEIDKILDLKEYNLNHSQSEETTEVLPSNNGEQVLLYNSYDSESQSLAEENDNLISWVANFTTVTMKEYRGKDLKKIAELEEGSFFNCLYTCKMIQNPGEIKGIDEKNKEIKLFTTAYDDKQILLSTDINENNMLSLKISSYNTSTKKIIKLFQFTQKRKDEVEAGHD